MLPVWEWCRGSLLLYQLLWLGHYILFMVILWRFNCVCKDSSFLSSSTSSDCALLANSKCVLRLLLFPYCAILDSMVSYKMTALRRLTTVLTESQSQHLSRWPWFDEISAWLGCSDIWGTEESEEEESVATFRPTMTWLFKKTA